MTSDQRSLLTALLEGLRFTEPGPKDAEFEHLVHELSDQLPDAPCLLVRALMEKERALEAAHRQLLRGGSSNWSSPAHSGVAARSYFPTHTGSGTPPLKYDYDDPLQGPGDCFEAPEDAPMLGDIGADPCEEPPQDLEFEGYSEETGDDMIV